MTRDEAVQKLATVGHLSMAHAEDLYDSLFPKPVVPQYVADWYEEIKGFDDDDTFLNYNTDWDYWFLEDDKRTEEVRVVHTRKELEDADFGWVFDCEGVEVKEVE